jgi:hypothetical protein
LYNLFSEGISARHGGHQDAQKLMNTTLPFKSEVLIVRPLASVNEKGIVLVMLSLEASAFFISALNKPLETSCCNSQDLAFTLNIRTKASAVKRIVPQLFRMVSLTTFNSLIKFIDMLIEQLPALHFCSFFYFFTSFKQYSIT